MYERGNQDSLPTNQTPGPNRLTQSDLEMLYILGDPRGVAALPENIEYDVREDHFLFIEGPEHSA